LQIFAKILLGKDPNPAIIEEGIKALEKSKTILESYFLKDHKFIHSDEISIADLQAVCEFTQFWLAGVDPFKDRPRLAQWMKDCQEQLQPHFDEVHKSVYDARDKGTFSGTL
jgi:glutathione S-transferase